MKKKMKPKKWLPEIGDDYWMVDFIRCSTYDPSDLVLVSATCEEIGDNWDYNVFKTKSHALVAKKKIIAILRGE